MKHEVFFKNLLKDTVNSHRSPSIETSGVGFFTHMIYVSCVNKRQFCNSLSLVQIFRGQLGFNCDAIYHKKTYIIQIVRNIRQQLQFPFVMEILV